MGPEPSDRWPSQSSWRRRRGGDDDDDEKISPKIRTVWRERERERESSCRIRSGPKMLKLAPLVLVLSLLLSTVHHSTGSRKFLTGLIIGTLLGESLRSANPLRRTHAELSQILTARRSSQRRLAGLSTSGASGLPSGATATSSAAAPVHHNPIWPKGALQVPPVLPKSAAGASAEPLLHHSRRLPPTTGPHETPSQSLASESPPHLASPPGWPHVPAGSGRGWPCGAAAADSTKPD